MTEYKCPRCLHLFCLKGDIMRHLKKKIPCSSSKGRDISLATCIEIFNTKISNIEYYNIKQKVESLEVQIISLTKQLKDVASTQRMKVIETNNGNITIGNGNITTNNITNNIVINNYTEPNTEYILSKHCDAALKNGNLTEGCLKMTRLIWFNSNHPENHSIYMSNKKDRSIQCMENGEVNEYKFDYKFKNIMDTILEVCERAEKESEIYYDLNDIFDNPDKPEYRKIYKEIEISLGKELYNRKEIVEASIKQFRKQRKSN